MKMLKIVTCIVAASALTACGNFPRVPGDKTVDRGINSHHLSTMVAGIWVDPNGCDHWIIDDGLEGYADPRLTPDGRPICSGAAAPNTAVGPFKAGSTIPDPI